MTCSTKQIILHQDGADVKLVAAVKYFSVRYIQHRMSDILSEACVIVSLHGVNTLYCHV